MKDHALINQKNKFYEETGQTDADMSRKQIIYVYIDKLLENTTDVFGDVEFLIESKQNQLRVTKNEFIVKIN